MSITNIFRICIGLFIFFYLFRYNAAFSKIPIEFFHTTDHLIPLNLGRVLPYFNPLAVFWLLLGVHTLYKPLSKMKWLFFVISYLLLSLVNQMYYPLKSDFLPLIFLFLLMNLNLQPHHREHFIQNWWIIQGGKILFVLLYFGAGLNKVLNSQDYTWVDPRTLEYYLFYQYQYYGCVYDYFKPLAEFLFKHPSVTPWSMALVLLFEVSYPLIMLERLKRFYIAATITFQVIVFFALGTAFLPPLMGLAFFIRAKDLHKS